MARNLNSITKLSRRDGVALHHKAIKYMNKRAYGPGQHGAMRRSKPSDYAVQLREKQKVKLLYGILEKQFRRYVYKAIKMEGVAGSNLLHLLESRLDNVCYRAGLATSRRAARQLVSHAHILLNGKKVDIPSIKVSVGDEISVKEKSKKNGYFTDHTTVAVDSSWLSIDKKSGKVKVVGAVTREELDTHIQEQLIIEFYSR